MNVYKLFESISRRGTVTAVICMIGAFGRVENGLRTWSTRFFNAAVFRLISFACHERERRFHALRKKKNGRF